MYLCISKSADLEKKYHLAFFISIIYLSPPTVFCALSDVHNSLKVQYPEVCSYVGTVIKVRLGHLMLGLLCNWGTESWPVQFVGPSGGEQWVTGKFPNGTSGNIESHQEEYKQLGVQFMPFNFQSLI